MNLCTRDDLKRMVELGFAACMHGEVFRARRLFEHLHGYDKNNKPVSIGLALSYIVTDEFEKGDEILDGLDSSDEVLSMKVVSFSLQRREYDARSYYERISDKSCAEAKMAASFLEHSSRA